MEIYGLAVGAVMKRDPGQGMGLTLTCNLLAKIRPSGPGPSLEAAFAMKGLNIYSMEL